VTDLRYVLCFFMSEESQKHGINPNSPQLSPEAADPKMDRDLHDLFVRFKLESVSTMVADALGVEVTSDFFDLEEKQILQTSKELSLKPVNETRLIRMYQFVVAGLGRNKLLDGAPSPEQNLTPRQQLSPQSTDFLSSGTLSPLKVSCDFFLYAYSCCLTYTNTCQKG
jgi:hypothetical protein